MSDYNIMNMTDGYGAFIFLLQGETSPDVLGGLDVHSWSASISKQCPQSAACTRNKSTDSGLWLSQATQATSNKSCVSSTNADRVYP